MTDPLRLTRLDALMARTEGRSEIAIGLIDGPVALDHPGLSERVRALDTGIAAACAVAESYACRHGTLVAGVLAARRGSGATAICPGCTLIVRPVFAESVADGAREMPAAEPAALAAALLECIRAGARVINLSAALVRSSIKDENALVEALDFAARRDVLIVAAAGNRGGVGGTPITRHPAVIPVAACDGQGRPLAYTTLSGSIGRRGLLAPGLGVAGLNAAGGAANFDGTSAATPLVTGTIALLWSEAPSAAAADVRQAVLYGAGPRGASIVPPRLDAVAAYRNLAARRRRAA